MAAQRVSSETEQGKYIYISVSSYIPQSGDDGFTFTEHEEGVYDYRPSIVN